MWGAISAPSLLITMATPLNELLLDAASKGDLDEVNALLAFGASPMSRVNTLRQQRTALGVACLRGFTDIVATLLEAGADASQFAGQAEVGFSDTFTLWNGLAAAAKGRAPLPLVELLVQAGARAHPPAGSDQHPLSILTAAIHGPRSTSWTLEPGGRHLEATEWLQLAKPALVKAGLSFTSPGSKFQGHSDEPVALLIRQGHSGMPVLRMLVEWGMPLPEQPSAVLSTAAMHGNRTALLFLLQHVTQTALDNACVLGAWDACKKYVRARPGLLPRVGGLAQPLLLLACHIDPRLHHLATRMTPRGKAPPRLGYALNLCGRNGLHPASGGAPPLPEAEARRLKLDTSLCLAVCQEMASQQAYSSPDAVPPEVQAGALALPVFLQRAGELNLDLMEEADQVQELTKTGLWALRRDVVLLRAARKV